jgi:hypothetical protein
LNAVVSYFSILAYSSATLDGISAARSVVSRGSSYM